MDRHISPSDASSTIPMEYVREHTNIRWNRYHLSCNKELTVEDIDTLPLLYATGKWDWAQISQHIDPQEILDHPKKPWLSLVMFNPRVTLDLIEPLQSVLKLPPRELAQMHTVVADRNPTIEMIREKPWLANRIDMAILRQHPDISTDRMYLGRNPTTRMVDVLSTDRNYDGRWWWHALSQVIPIDEIYTHPNNPWTRDDMSLNPTVRLKHVLDPSAPGKGGWNWNRLSKVIPMHGIRANPHLPWDPIWMLENPEITLEDINIMNIS